jgi:hypothetical protein
VYLALILLAMAGIFPEKGISYSVLAALLALALIFFIVRPRPSRYNISLDMALLFLTPLMLSTPLENLTGFTSTVAGIIAIALTLPAFYLLDYHLRENSVNSLTAASGRRRPTIIFLSLAISSLGMMLLAPVVNRPVLLFTGIAFLMYLLGALAWILLKIPHPAFTVTAVPKRIVAGTAGDLFLEINSRATVPLHAFLSPTVPWAKAAPHQAVLKKGANRFALNFIPPLAGQSRPGLMVSAIDPRGLFLVNESVEPVELHVIPRAQYAAWLARKYLAQTYSGSSTLADIPVKSKLNAKRGTEYRESRDYRPGDTLRDIDWKHTLKLSQLIVREYQEAGEQGAIIAVNLAVTDEETRDKLAFNLITVALTLAREKIPIALAAYNHLTVVHTTRVIEPAAALVQALSLTAQIAIVEFSGRLLEATDIAKIRRNIKQLRQVKTESAQRLLDFLDFEHRSTEEVAHKNPATRALAAVTHDTPAPAMIFLISQFNHDTEAILVNAEKLALKNYNVLPVASA